MTERKNGRHPERAEQERDDDLTWIGENLHILWRAAAESYAKFGKGLVVVDLTTTIMGGHPIFFMAQSEMDDIDEDTTRMINGYDPSWELVISLLKDNGRTSTYQVRIPDRKPR